MPTSFDTRRQEGMDPILGAAIQGRQINQQERELAMNLGALQERMRIQGAQEQRQATEFGQNQQALGGIGQFQSQVEEPGVDVSGLSRQFLEERRKTMSPQAFALMVPEVIKATKEHILTGQAKKVGSKIQDVLKGLQETPGMERFSSELEPLVSELDMVGMTGDPEAEAKLLDSISHRAEGKIGAIREFKQREEDKLAAIAGLQEQENALPLGHPLRTQFQLARHALELNLTKPLDAIRGIRMQDAGVQEIAPGVWVDPTRYAGFQQRGQQAQMEEAGRNQRFERGAGLKQQGLDLDVQKLEQDKAKAEAELKVKQQNANTAQTRANRPRPPTPKEIDDRTNSIMFSSDDKMMTHERARQQAIQEISQERGTQSPAAGGAPAPAQPATPTKPPPGFMDDYEKLPEAEKAKVRAMKPEWFPGGK